MSIELLERAAQALDSVLGDVAVDSELRAYLTDELTRLHKEPRFREGIAGALRADSASQARAEMIVLPRIEQLIG